MMVELASFGERQIGMKSIRYGVFVPYRERSTKFETSLLKQWGFSF